MSLKRDALAIALTLTLIISIPAAAETVNISSNQNKFFQIDKSGRFGSAFSLDFSNASRNSRLKTPEYAVKTSKTPDKQVKTYTAPKAKLKITFVNATTRKEKIVTPYGTLTTGVRKGRIFEDFKGINKSKVLEIKTEVEKKIDSKVTELEERETNAIRSQLPEIEFSVVEGEEEYVNITNKAEREVDLSGWKMVSESSSYSDRFTINTVKIRPGQTYSFYTDQGPMKKNAVYETGMTLYSDSGTLTVYTDEGLKYTEITYS